ncbi:STAS/SEC14 domain-containing protein [Polyangium sorediatum]|uniref:STAS/SEC14 domain-containing protein n=1 Tax=Polyangium sorediatum TaxID=889274 RepID=A0ABT6NHX8_9BACT|nr:STAS/SEC14 domain-containing protein [Polyangium sorediatum]MDI1427917.1 STAS/SEC14 domain-containing protein [Polyangium sorediatum]
MANAYGLWEPGHSLDAPIDLIPGVARFEPPDIVSFRLVRELTADEIKRVFAFTHEAAARTGGLFSMTDASVPFTRISVSAGLEFNRQFNPRMVRAAAVVGASYRMRMLSETLVRAARLLKLEIADAPVRYFDDDVAARAWFDTLRQGAA